MKKILALVLFAALAAPASATWSYDGNDGNNIWATDGTWRIKFIKNGGTYYIGGWENGGATLDLTTIYEDLAAEEAPHLVPFTNIGNDCFKNNKVVETVVLPARCTTIGSNTFNGCTALKTATMPGVTTVNQGTFNGCSSLVDVDCPNLKNIASYGAFQNCTSLVELKVSADMTAFSTDTFRGCTSFTTLYTNDATKVVGHVQLPPGVTSLGNYNFYQTKIVRIDAPNVTSIGGQSAFAGCTLLKEAHFPKLSSLTGTAAFNGCTALETVEISSALSGTIQNQNFNGCTSLSSVYQSGNEPVEGLVDLPVGVTKLEWGCFQNCKTIEHVVAPGLVNIQNRAFTSCTALETVRVSPQLSVLHNNNNNTQAAFYNCTSLVDFYPSTIPNLTELRAGMFQNCSSLTNAFDFSGATLSDVSGSHFFNGAKNVPCVRLPASFPKLYQSEFYGMKPGAELHFAGDIPLRADTSKNDQMYAGKSGAGNRYKIFVDAETYPNWTNGTNGATFTPKTAAMESESDYPGVATLGYLKYASSGQDNWLVQEPFYVDVTFYDEDGTTVLGIEQTLLGSVPAWTGATPTKDSTPQYDYPFAGWSTDGTTVVELATLRVNAPMSFRAVYAPALRSYSITWQWFDGTATQTETDTLDYGEAPSHAPVERTATTEYTYTFLGWSTDGSTVLSSIPSVTESATYIAVFEEKEASATVTVRWLDDDGTTVLGTTWPDKGTAAVAPVTPTKASTVSTDYAFAGWSIDGSTVLADLTVNADTDFIAVYISSMRRYTVAFMDWDGSEIDARDYDYGTAAENVVLPANPTRTATAEYTYSFSGWNPATVSAVTGDAVYTAQYEATANTYSATFIDSFDETTIEGPTSYAYGADVTPPAAPEHYGYTFAAWSPAVTTMPAADTTYTATYTTNAYTITWMNANGVSLGTTKVAYHTMPAHDDASMNGTSKESYDFAGWEPALEPTESNTTYTAVYTRTILTPMALALKSASYDRETGAITVLATILNPGQGGETTGTIVTEPATDGNVVTVENGTNVTATIVTTTHGNGYEWTLSVTQTASGVAETTSLKGRTWARKSRIWFDGADGSDFTGGSFAPGESPLNQQARICATLALPSVLPRALPAAAGAVAGISPCQENAGQPPLWRAWNGEAWVPLHGPAPVAGASVEIAGVVDFARKAGGAYAPAAAWYANGIQLTTADGGWEVPLAAGANIARFGLDGEAGVLSAFDGEYSVGVGGTMVLFR